MYHVVMVYGGGFFELDVDNSFLKTKYNPSIASFPSSTRVDFGSGLATRIIGEKMTTTSVRSYQLTFSSVGGWTCFGMILVPDINTVTLDGGSFDGWGSCADTGSGSMWPIGSINWVCPCTNCDNACTKCTGPTQNECSACSSGYYLQPSSTSCQISCPPGYWKDGTNRICAACHSACTECSGPNFNQCSACSTGYFLQPASTICLNFCPNGYGEDTVNRVCVSCDTSCSQCTGPTNTQCSACSPGYFLQPSSTTCLDSCPVLYWADLTNNICLPCDTSCSICLDGTNNQCSSCVSGYFLQPSSTTCLNFCPVGYWQDTTNHICANCDISCSQCTGPLNTQCSACSTGYFQQPASTICLSSCPNGYWEDVANRVCASCDTPCSQCTGPSDTQCSACNAGFFLQPPPSETTCLNSCPVGYWQDTTNHICASCDISCSRCTGPLNSQCSACNAGYTLQPSSTTCLKKDDSSDQDPTNCNNGFYIYNNSSYVAECPSEYYSNTTDCKCYEGNKNTIFILKYLILPLRQLNSSMGFSDLSSSGVCSPRNRSSWTKCSSRKCHSSHTSPSIYSCWLSLQS